MSDLIYDNPETMCREVHVIHNALEAGSLLLSIPKAAIDLRMSPMFMPWGTYATRSRWGCAGMTKPHKFNPRCGIRRNPEELAKLQAVVNEWMIVDRKTIKMKAFWEARAHDFPEISFSAFKSFLHNERIRIRTAQTRDKEPQLSATKASPARRKHTKLVQQPHQATRGTT